jgi:hypothetical protein
MDETWLNTVNSFASDRGAVAHGASITVQAIDPQTTVDTVNQILEGLKQLDMVFEGLA